jgi:hypothetical protein
LNLGKLPEVIPSITNISKTAFEIALKELI